MFTLGTTAVLMLSSMLVAGIGAAYLFFYIGHRAGSNVDVDVATEQEIEVWMNDLRTQRSQTRLFDQDQEV